jgi:hypothetical protein
MKQNDKENHYKMFPEYNFAVVKLCTDNLYFDELEHLNHEYKNDKNYSKIHALLIDVDKRCKLSFGIKELPKLANSYNIEPQKNNHRVIVWLVSQPRITALTHLFLGNIRDNSKYCSTLEKAYQLLKIEIDYEKFIELVKGNIKDK